LEEDGEVEAGEERKEGEKVKSLNSSESLKGGRDS